jgi:hypothetical protein
MELQVFDETRAGGQRERLDAQLIRELPRNQLRVMLRASHVDGRGTARAAAFSPRIAVPR